MIEDRGPHRLVILMEETTDEAADLRRVRRICAALDEHPGDLPVELRIRQRNERVARLRRAGVDPASLGELTPRLRALLGVLGTAREVGAAAATGVAELAAVAAR